MNRPTETWRATACAGLALASLATSAAASGQATVRPLDITDYYAIVDVSSPAIAPDGSRVAFVRETVLEDENRVHREVWLAPTDDSAEPRRITDPSYEASEPVWSPDGRLLAFRSARRAAPEDGAGAWRFLDLARGGESFRIEGIEGRPVFSPDGLWVAFVRPVPPTGEARRRFGRSRYDVVPDAIRAIEERFAGSIIEWMQYRWDGRGYLPDPRSPVATPPRELHVVPISGGIPRQLTSLGVDVLDPAWSPSSNLIAFAADLGQRDEHTYERHDVWAIDLERQLVRLTDGPNDDRTPVWVDDSSVVFHRTEGLDALLERRADRGSPEQLVRVSLPASPTGPVDDPVVVTEGWDQRIGAHRALPDGALVFPADLDGERHLFRVPATGGAVTPVTEGRRRLSGFDFSADGSLMAYLAETPTAPRDLRVARIDGGGERPITRFNALLLADVALAAARNFRATSADGTEVEGWLMLPPGYRAGDGALPALLAIHGGPHGSWGEGFSFEFQLWASEGYAVVYSNPRGSTGYGEDFLWATWGGGWGGLDSDDVLAALEHVTAEHDIDTERLGVTGYSYGGFLTNWLITQDDRFAAAVSGAGISNWISDYATSDIPRTKESEFYGPPWDPAAAEMLWHRSPVGHAAGVSTPTLFLHGEADWRVPIEQAEQMYLALRKQRVPARFVRYPDTSHGGWSPWDEVHSMWQTLEWWERWLSEAD